MTTVRLLFVAGRGGWTELVEAGGAGQAAGHAIMSEKYMSIGAPMTELPVAQPRGHTSHSHRHGPPPSTESRHPVQCVLYTEHCLTPRHGRSADRRLVRAG